MDYLIVMRVDPHTFAENFIPEDHFKTQARARGVELGTVDTTPGAGAFLKYLASTLKAQSVVEVELDPVLEAFGYLMACCPTEL